MDVRSETNNVASVSVCSNQDDMFETMTANHPLMVKFQEVLQSHLLRVHDELQEEVNDIESKVNILNNDREEFGANLYDLHHEIEKQKDSLDCYNENIKEKFELRLKDEDKNKQFDTDLKAAKRQYFECQKVYEEKLMELRKVRTLEQNVMKWRNEMHSEIEVSKRMVSKDKQNKQLITMEKHHMDLLLLNLEMEVLKRETENRRLNEEIQSQREILQTLNSNLTDANSDLDIIQSEQKKLFNSWNDVVHAIETRDKIIAKTTQELTNEIEKRKVLKTEIDGTRKQTQKEMEQNEVLEHVKQRMANESNKLSRQLCIQTRENVELHNKMEEIENIIDATKDALSRSLKENQLIEGYMFSSRREFEKYTQQKIKLEENILGNLQNQVNADQVSRSYCENIRNLQEKRRDIEIKMYKTEECVADVMFELEKLKGEVIRNKQLADELQNDKMIIELKSNEYDKELNSIKKNIQTKLREFDNLNRKLSQMIDSAGGVEIDPTEGKIIHLTKSIDELENGIREDQKTWLRIQTNLIEMSEKRSRQLNDIHLTRKQLMILEQKQLRINKELNEAEHKEQTISRNIRNCNTRFDILSSKLFERKQNSETEKSNCQEIHAKMVERLKQNEMCVFKLHDEIHCLSRGIDELKGVVLNCHREALSWETKWKLTSEAKRQRDEELNKAGDIGIMRSEIHRMEVRLSQLKRAQEKLAQDMETCIHHRDHIFDGSNIRSKLNEIKPSKMVNTKQYKINEIKTKLKQSATHLASIEKQIEFKNEEKQLIETELNKINDIIEDERLQFILLQDEIDQANILRQQNLEHIIHIQQRAKRYRNLTGSAALPKIRNECTIESQIESQTEIQEQLISILEGLLNEFPNHKLDIARVLSILKDRF